MKSHEKHETQKIYLSLSDFHYGNVLIRRFQKNIINFNPK